ncbi:MAG: VWA domain-containing protein, partial [Lentisphaerae bacterium]|nr:VWA domain-containing protein [Lentisphaerota bacterium]
MPLFLWSLLAGAAASIPVALHLLHRRKPKPVPFSSLRFLHEAIAKTRRSRHLTNVFTLLMRVLIMVLLVFAFKQDKVRFSWIPEGKRTVVIVLDASASMRYQDGEDTCFARASEWALNLIRSLDEEDQVAVLMPGLPEPRLIFPPISDHETVNRAIQQAQPGYGAADLVELLNDMIGRLSEEDGTAALEFHVFSDFQKAGWNDAEAEGLNEQLTDQEILLFLNHVQPTVTANAGLSKAFFYPPAILGDGDFQAKAHVRSSADYSGGNTLRLIVQSNEQKKKPFRLLPDQTVTEIIGGVAEGEAQYVLGQLELDDDAFPVDNVFRFCLPRLPGIPVLLVDGSGRNNAGFRDTPFLKHAIQPKGKARTLFLPRTVDWTTFKAGPLDDSRVLFLC